MVADAPHTAIVGHDAAAIAMDETANELFMMLGYELRLPICQGDLSFVLSSWSMLREQARPVVGAHRNDVTAARSSRSAPGSLSRSDRLERVPAGFDDAWVRRVEKDPEAIRPGATGDAPITQVEAQQIDVLGWGQLDAAGCTDGAWASAAELTVASRQITGAPVTNRAPWDARQTGDGTIGDAVSHKGENGIDLGLRSHEHMFA